MLYHLTFVKMQYGSIILTIFHVKKSSLSVVKLFGQGHAELIKNPLWPICLAYAFLGYVKLSSKMSPF